MLICSPTDMPGSSITPEGVYLSRRHFVRGLAAAGGAALAGVSGRAAAALDVPHTDEALTPEEIVTSYNNFYEFGTGKTDPARYAHAMTVSPWQVEVGGACGRGGTYDIEDVLAGLTPEERVYRFRCV
jgi:sulfoxide reductase catalytic subunit YedY